MGNLVICTLELITSGGERRREVRIVERAMHIYAARLNAVAEQTKYYIYLRRTSVCETVVACLKHATRQIKYGDV